ncbi:tetratricopeptide repeat protein [Jannaschia aquimarina]|uniref:Tetratricopeptide repeat protein n=1 Tax=Jannaschia aquimarina TaxID=935700 RepID=A0A0D1EH08_9RHOB|nr:tetratricopeptide repeat protein [Jannaschia aquimarina]KIT16176.1 Tetratricopeptide repeat protein [Jannaschia aquimarina]SNT36706.1 hypothetical protein SAMN05421775_1135 [Jannaschia aquimarina]
MIDPCVTLKAAFVALACSYATFSAAQEAESAPVDIPSDAPDVLSEDPQVLLDMLASEADPAEADRLANEVLERWSRSGSPTIDVLMRRAADAMSREDWSRAIAHLTAATDHAPGFAEAWNKRAEAFFMAEETGMALADIEQTLILEPRHFGALAGLGIILEQLGEDRAALNAFRRAQEIYPAEQNVSGAVERLEAVTGGRTL